MTAARAQLGTMPCTLPSLGPPGGREPAHGPSPPPGVYARNLRSHDGENLPKVLWPEVRWAFNQRRLGLRAGYRGAIIVAALYSCVGCTLHSSAHKDLSDVSDGCRTKGGRVQAALVQSFQSPLLRSGEV